MNTADQPTPDVFRAADWYARGIDWAARLAREIPVLCDVFGPPGTRGLLDAGCGPGRQLAALRQRGYHVTGLDASAEMLALARAHAAELGLTAEFREARFDAVDPADGLFDGVYCLGNSLAATGSAEACAASFAALAAVLAPGGVLFVQVLNFAKLRTEQPAVRGPRVTRHAGREYVSARVYAFGTDRVDVTNVTFWHDGQWRQHAHGGTLYPVEAEELGAWCADGGLAVEALYGSYGREVFAPTSSVDLLLVARNSATT